MQALLLLPLMALALRSCGLRRVQTFLAQPAPLRKQRLDPAGFMKTLRMARIFGIAARYGWYQGTCLPRSLMLWWWLRWLGAERPAYARLRGMSK